MKSSFLTALVVLLAAGAWLITRVGADQVALTLGGVLVVAGAVLLVLARRQLGRAFAVTPQARGLVTHGLYSRIPHPMYAFLDLCVLGIIIALRQGWFLVVWFVLIALQTWQARREAKILEEAYGEAYRRYREQTWW